VREQVALARNERFRNRIKAARDLSIAAGVALVICAAVWAVWSASRARGVVVEPFSVPPALAAEGLTGQAAAARMLDHVAAMEPTASELALAGVGVRSSESGGLRVEIPQSGVSLDEVSRWLRRTVGDERVVSGDVRREAGRLWVTVRVSGQPGDVVSGPEAQMDQVLKLAAERVYGRTEPLRYSRHLYDRAGERWNATRREWARRGRPPTAAERAAAKRERQRDFDAAVQVARRVAQGGGPDQAWGYAFWGTHLWGAESRAADSVRLLERARRLDPDLAYAPANLTSIYNVLGEPHLEREAAEAADRLFRKRRSDVARGHVRWARFQMQSSADRTVGAYGDGARKFCEAAARGWQLPNSQRGCALYLARNHDARGAEAAWALVPEEDRNLVPPIQIAVFNAQTRGDVAAEIAAHQRWVRAAAEEGREVRAPAAVWPTLAVALARAGRQAEAEALAARTPDCYECLRARGRVAAIGRDWTASERWLRAAVRRGPTVPFAYLDLAEVRLGRGDLSGAEAALAQARRHGPRWADPLKLQGDLLASQGEHRIAVRRYAQAARRAPRWGALHLAWGQSLEALGREKEARRKYEAALRMDLNPADRATIERLLS
jgi:tetratricopeptide (TPR) repeat protein